MLGLYFATSRITLSIALCYMIFACAHNAGGPINWFLSHPHWELLSKLSYAIYLTHLPILLITVFSIKEPMYFNEFSAFLLFIGSFVFSSVISVLAALAFEMPIVNIYKLIKKTKNISIASNSADKQNKLNCAGKIQWSKFRVKNLTSKKEITFRKKLKKAWINYFSNNFNLVMVFQLFQAKNSSMYHLQLTPIVYSNRSFTTLKLRCHKNLRYV